MQNYGNTIKLLRIKNGYTQKSLADKLGVSNQAVSKWENNVNQPDITTLVAMCEIFGVTVDEFLKLGEDSHNVCNNDAGMFFDEKENSVDKNEKTDNAYQNNAPLNSGINYDSNGEFKNNNNGYRQGNTPYHNVNNGGRRQGNCNNNGPVKKRPKWLVGVIICSIVFVISSIQCISAILIAFNGVKKITAKIPDTTLSSIISLESYTTAGVNHGGTGFFIDDEGVAVTDLSSISDTTSVKAILHDGSTYNVKRVLGVNREAGIAIIKIPVSGNTYLSLKEKDYLEVDSQLYVPYINPYNKKDRHMNKVTVSDIYYKIGDYEYYTFSPYADELPGGPVVNKWGVVLGMISSKARSNGYSSSSIILSKDINAVERNYNCTINEFFNSKEKFYINFYDGNNLVTSQNVKYGKYAENVNLEKINKGYKFVGWSKFYNSKILYDFSEPVKEQFSLYAVWEPVKYSITFKNPGNGIEGNMDSYGRDVVYDENIVLPECVFTKEGYRFDHWLYSGKSYSAGERVKNLAYKEGERVNFEAVFEKIKHFTLSFDNNLDGAKGSLPDNMEVDNVKALTIPSNILTHDGYIMTGWIDKNNNFYEPGCEILIDLAKDGEKYILTAKWEKIKYNITFDFSNNGYQEECNVEHNANLQLPDMSVIIKDGYYFEGWEYDGVLYESNGIINNFSSKEQNVTITAKWHGVTCYVKYFATGEKGEDILLSEESYVYGSDYFLPVKIGDYPQKGYKITSWRSLEAIHEAGKTAEIFSTDKTKPTELHAMLNPVTYEYIILTSDNESECYHGTGTYGTDPSANMIEYLTSKYGKVYFDKEGYGAYDYKFLNSDMTVYTGDMKYICSEQDGKVYVQPQWKEKKYRIEFNYGEAANYRVEGYNLSYNEKFTLPDFKPESYSFTGWELVGSYYLYKGGAIVSGLNEGTIDYDSISNCIVNMNAYCKPYRYVVNFNANGGGGNMESLNGVVNKKLFIPVCTYKNIGKLFAGWDYNGKTIVSGETHKFKVLSDGYNIELKAIWCNGLSGEGTKENPYKISSFEDLALMSSLVANYYDYSVAHYELTADIDCSKGNIYPTGISTRPFCGFFDGKNHCLNNIVFAKRDGMMGLFGNVERGCISNVYIKNYRIDATDDVYIAGPLVCNYNSDYAITNCQTYGNVNFEICRQSENDISVGGFAGILNGFAENCSSDGNIKVNCLRSSGYTKMNIGGFAGKAVHDEMDIEHHIMANHCYSNSNINFKGDGISRDSEFYIGGFSGYTGQYLIYNSVATGNITADLKCAKEQVHSGRFTGENYISEFYNTCVSAQSILNIGWEFKDVNYNRKENSVNLNSILWLKENLGFDDAIWSVYNGKVALKYFIK